MDDVYRSGVRVFMALTLCLLLLQFFSGVAWAQSGPVQTQTLAAGPYVIDVNLYQSQPFTDTPLEMTVVPHDSTLHLQGRIIADPGLGTDAVELHAPLSPIAANSTILRGAISMPVQGAWQIGIALDGPRGSGTAHFPVTVAAPGAIPVWLGWLIAVTPLLGVAWWLWRQHHYRRTLVAA
ncbi:MAG TPA: hypothetical protein VKY19_03655 [Ktedonosporobacter sp.]|jgi:hypothetical protein|nr:hypothetical protein [Ktedonosporobacter sp.]